MIYACSITEGLSNLKYHAERIDGTAACSNYLNVSREGPAASIDKRFRCNSAACKKLFAQADATAKTENADGTR